MRFIDPDGMQADDLILKGSKPSVDKAVETINSGLGGKYATVDDDGKVSLSATTEQIDCMTSEQKGLYDVVNQTMDPNEKTQIEVVASDSGVIFGDYKGGKIDIDDINALGTSIKQETKYSALGHEINEQYEYQQGNTKEYSSPGSSHMNSVAKEHTMNDGWHRGKSNNYEDPSATKNIIRGDYSNDVKRVVYGQNNTYNINFSKKGTTVVSTSKVVNGNTIPRK